MHENQIGNIPITKGHHAKAFSMSSYVLQKQQPKTQQMTTTIGSVKQASKKNPIKASINHNNQKSQSNFSNNFAVPSSFDARKTFHNN